MVATALLCQAVDSAPRPADDLAGWLGLFAPASSVIDGLTFLGFVGFFVWMAAMGIALLRRGSSAEELAPLATQG